MKKTFYFFFTICISLNTYSQSQTYNPQGTFKDYAGTTVITSQVKVEENKAVLRGTEAEKNCEFVIKNYIGIQPSVFHGFKSGF